MYRQLRRWSSPDPNYHWVEIRFWYFDNSVYGNQPGTDRLNRMRSITNAQSGIFGKFQVEYRRTSGADITSPPQEGWDAEYEDWSLGFCRTFAYGTDTNLPSWGLEHEEITGDCNSLQNDEEAEVTTNATEQMGVYVGQDPTNVHLQQNPPIYRYAVKFYRRPANQGQSFHLHTKYEMLDDVIADTDGFDIEIPIRYSDWTY